MRETNLRIVLFSFLIASFFAVGASFGAEDRPQRTITVCALNDTAAAMVDDRETPPVSKESIREIIDEASKEYEANVGIRFELAEYHEIGIPVISLESEIKLLRSFCPGQELVVVFSNQEALSFDSSGNLKSPLGSGNPEYGIVWIYRVDFRNHKKSGYSPKTTLVHEIGHLFLGKEHSPKGGDFMNKYANSDAWSEKLRREIRSNIHYKWKTEYEPKEGEAK